jgi:hypothetical protein
MLTLLFFLLIVIFGYLIVSLVLGKVSFVERVALSYLLGLGLITYAIFVYGMVDHYFNSFKICAFIVCLDLALAAINIYLKKINIKFSLGNIYKKLKELNIFDVLLLTAIGLLSFVVAMNNYYWPVSHWDAMAIYDARAKFFVLSGNIDSMFPSKWYFSYPLFTSIAHAIFYFSGSINPMFIYTFLYVSFIVCLYFLMRRSVSRTLSLFFSFWVSVSYPIFSHAQMSYTNLPFTIFLVLGFLYLWDWIINKNRGSFYISLLLVSLSTWVRAAEPFWGVAIVVLLFYSIKNKKFASFIFYTVFIYLFRYLWYYYQSHFLGFTSYLPSESVLFESARVSISALSIKRIYDVSIYIWKNAISLNFFLLVAYILSLSLNWKINFWRRIYSAMFIFGIYLMIIVGTFIYSIVVPPADYLQIGDSLQRIVMIFPPLFYFFIALNIQELFHSKK